MLYFPMYDTILSTLEREEVELYLANKFNQPFDLGPDILACAESVEIGIGHNSQYENIIWSTGATNSDSVTIVQNGTYWVSLKSFGLTITDTIVITGIVPKPQISLSSDQVLCFGDSIEVNYTPLPGYTTSWLNGETSNTIFVKEYSQFVQVMHTDIYNCSANSDCSKRKFAQMSFRLSPQKAAFISSSLSARSALGVSSIACIKLFNSPVSSNAAFTLSHLRSGMK